MSIDDLNKCKKILIDNFRWIKLEKDHARFQLILFQLLDLISQYEKLIDFQEEMQSKHYQTIKHMEEEGLIVDFDYVKWHQQRTDEIMSWKHELDILTNYKNQINSILEQIENGTAEQALIEQEKELLE